jgi:hypothetical protein
VTQRGLLKYCNGEKANTIHQDPSITEKRRVLPICKDLKFVVQSKRGVSTNSLHGDYIYMSQNLRFTYLIGLYQANYFNPSDPPTLSLNFGFI